MAEQREKPVMLASLVGSLEGMDLESPRYAVASRDFVTRLLSSGDDDEETKEIQRQQQEQQEVCDEDGLLEGEMPVAVVWSLVRMLRAYIPNVDARALFMSGEYEAMACVAKRREEWVVIGGCAFKPHAPEGDGPSFVELALFCTDIACQGRGLGGALMKRLIRRCRSTYGAVALFAYADLKAFPFFRRMDFTRTIHTPHSVWRKRIVSYN